MADKERMSLYIGKDVTGWLEKLGKHEKSSFVENTLRDKINKSKNPAHAIREKIKYHEQMSKQHNNIATELTILERRKKGDLKLVDTAVWEAMKKKSDKLNLIEGKDGAIQFDSMIQPIKLDAAAEVEHAIDNAEKIAIVNGHHDS